VAPRFGKSRFQINNISGLQAPFRHLLFNSDESEKGGETWLELSSFHSIVKASGALPIATAGLRVGLSREAR
jgi:hypothetical protein